MAVASHELPSFLDLREGTVLYSDLSDSSPSSRLGDRSRSLRSFRASSLLELDAALSFERGSGAGVVVEAAGAAAAAGAAGGSVAAGFCCKFVSSWCIAFICVCIAFNVSVVLVWF